MDVIAFLINFVLNVDQALVSIIQVYGMWTYLIIFIVIFSETGFVVTPFLPGDSLLFVAGWLASIGSLNFELLFIVFSLAAIIGDSVNYFIGYKVGQKIFQEKKSRFFNKKYLDESRRFYEKHGGKSVLLARFIPFIRTFVPLTAGIGRMNYKRFILFNIIGGVSWVVIFITGGFFSVTSP
jgi:membrane-associated protein